MVPHGTSLNAGLCRRTIFCWRTKRTKINRTGGCGSEFFLVFTVSCLRHVFFKYHHAERGNDADDGHADADDVPCEC